MNNDKLLNYLNSLDQWMVYFGFEKVILEDDMGMDRIYSRYKTDLSKFSKSSTYCCVKYVEQGVDGNWMQQFSSNLFTFATRHRTGIPIGIGGSLTVYPLLITESVSFDLAAFIKKYTPKHYSAFEFPVVLEFVNDNLYYLESTPMWGALYYSGFRKETFQLYSVKAWKEISERISK